MGRRGLPGRRPPQPWATGSVRSSRQHCQSGHASGAGRSLGSSGVAGASRRTRASGRHHGGGTAARQGGAVALRLGAAAATLAVSGGGLAPAAVTDATATVGALAARTGGRTTGVLAAPRPPDGADSRLFLSAVSAVKYPGLVACVFLAERLRYTVSTQRALRRVSRQALERVAWMGTDQELGVASKSTSLKRKFGGVEDRIRSVKGVLDSA